MTATATKTEPAAGEDKPRAPEIQTSKTKFARKLARAIEASDRAMDPFRDQMDRMVREFCGPHHGSNRTEAELVPVNLLYLFVTSVMPHLAITPRLQAEARDPDFEYVGTSLAEAVNHECKRIGLGESFLMVLMDSCFAMSILKIGLAIEGNPVDDSQSMEDPAIMFCDPVSLKDYVEDCGGRTRKRLYFQGDYERLPIEAALATDAYDRALVEKLRNTKAQRAGDTKKRTAPGLGTYAEDGDLYDMVELCHVYLPYEQRVVTLPASLSATTDFLVDRPWTDEDFGPYETFGLTPVPGSTMPLAPLSVGYDLHLLVNEVNRKIGRQAQRDKELDIVDPSDPKLANTIRTAQDGQVILGNPANAKRLTSGGVHKGLYQTAEFLQRKFDETMGSPEVLGGTGMDANTLGQDQMKMANAGQRINWWRSDCLRRGRRVLERAARYVWNDPLLELDLKVPIGGGRFLRTKWTPDMRVGRLSDYILEMEAYSVTQDSPGQEYERINRLIKEEIIPLAAIAAQGGFQLDVVRLVEILARKADLPELQGIFRGMPVPGALQGVMGQGGQAPGAPGGNTTTNISLGGRARPQRQGEFMAGQGAQPAETEESVA